MSTPENIYAQALDQAKQELDFLVVEFERIETRKNQLEAFIANAQPLIGTHLVVADKTVPTTESVTSVVTSTLPPPPQPIWKSILLSIKDRSDVFSVNDVLKALDGIGRGVPGPNAYRIVRNVLNTKEQNFEKVGPGIYCIKRTTEHGQAGFGKGLVGANEISHEKRAPEGTL